MFRCRASGRCCCLRCQLMTQSGPTRRSSPREDSTSTSGDSYRDRLMLSCVFQVPARVIGMWWSTTNPIGCTCPGLVTRSTLTGPSNWSAQWLSTTTYCRRCCTTWRCTGTYVGGCPTTDQPRISAVLPTCSCAAWSANRLPLTMVSPMACSHGIRQSRPSKRLIV